MKQKSSGWLFPTTGLVVSFVYYFSLFLLLVFVFYGILKLLGNQILHPMFGEEAANQISVPVSWQERGEATLQHPAHALIQLNPNKHEGVLQVPTRSKLGLTYITQVITVMMGYAWFFWILRQIFRHTNPVSPFYLDNSRRISLMGMLMIAYSLIQSIFGHLIHWQARPYIEEISPNLTSPVTYNLSPNGMWLFGLVLLALAQVYRRGVEIQQENELTV